VGAAHQRVPPQAPVRLRPQERVHRTRHACGTPAYAAPEALVCRDFNNGGALDVGSLAPIVPVVPVVTSARCLPGGSRRRHRDRHNAHGSFEAAPLGPLDYDAGKADVWSLAVSMVVIATGFFPWREARPSDARYAFWAGAWRGADLCPEARHARLAAALHEVAVGESGRALPEGLLRLLVQMLNPDPEARLSMGQVADDWWLLGEGIACSFDTADSDSIALPSPRASEEEEVDVCGSRGFACAVPSDHMG
jgi:serine/threonine protein kinase